MRFVFQYILPHYYINKAAKFLAECRIIWVKKFLIHWFIKKYQVNMQEVKQLDYFAYPTFNDFFTRELNATARHPEQGENIIISPADGLITQYGSIKNNILFNVKNASISLANLLVDQELITASTFSAGKFMVIYLAPHNYHRIHMPCNAVLEKMLYIPGKLFSVNSSSKAFVPDVFIKNERVIAIFNTKFGKIAIILVGALIVGSIVTSWHGQVIPCQSKKITTWVYPQNTITLTKFQEMGLFKLGSTVIVLFSNNNINFDENIFVNKAIKVGEKIATFMA